MKQVFDWETEMQEIRTKATVAAKHSERIVGGVSQALSQISEQSRQLSEAKKALNEIGTRLGALEASQRGFGRLLLAQEGKIQQGPSVVLLWALGGVLAGFIMSAVFFWN
jgi:chromosome segregation ATPase